MEKRKEQVEVIEDFGGKSFAEYCQNTTIPIFHNIVHRRTRKIVVFSKSTILPRYSTAIAADNTLYYNG